MINKMKEDVKSKKVRGRDQKGFSLVSVVFTMLALSAVGLGMTSDLAVKASGATANFEGQEAFYIAEGGLQYVIDQELYNSSDFTTANTVNNKTLGNGTFSVTYSNATATSVVVNVTSVSGNATRTIQQTVARVPSVSGALHSGGNISLENSQSGSGTITGDISYGGNYTNEGGYTVTGTVTSGSAPSTVNVAAVRDLTTSTISGNQTITGAYTNNVYITGNVTITGTSTVTGIIVAGGNLTVDMDHSDVFNMNGTLAAYGNIVGDMKQSSRATYTAQSAGGSMQPALLAGGNIDYKLKQDTINTFNGLIKAGGNVEFELYQNDTVTVNGAIQAGGNILEEVKQSTTMTVNLNSGSSYLPNSFTMTNWKDI